MSNQEEYKIHVAMIDYLKGEKWHGNKLIHSGTPAFEGLLVMHIPNQRHSEDAASEGYFMKRMGVLAGAYDLLLFWPHRNAGAYDVKAKDGTLTTAQRKFRGRWHNMGFPDAYGSSLAHLRDTLMGWGLKCLNPHVVEPDLSTKSEKFQRAMDFYKP